MMTEEQARQFGEYIKNKRMSKRMSGRQLALAAGVDSATVVRLERGHYRTPKPDTIRGIAEALKIPVGDLFTMAEYLPAYDLPELSLYLRTKYDALPEDAIQEMDRYFKRITAQYGLAIPGPNPGEDEAPTIWPEDIPEEDLQG